MESLSYIVVTLNQKNGADHPGAVTIIENGRSSLIFDVGNTNNIYVARYGAKHTLTYTPPTTVSGGTKVPGEFKLTDDKGNVTTFYDVPRTDNEVVTSGSVSFGTLYGGNGRPQQVTNDWFDTSGVRYTGTSGTTAKYRFGAFKTYSDASTKLRVTASYDSDGNLSSVIRSDGSGAFERFAYTYTQITNSAGASDWFMTQVTLSRATGASGSYTAPSSWSDVRKVSYSYYDGFDAGSDYGRFGDLKLVTIATPSSATIEKKYYRYNLLPARQFDGRFTIYSDLPEYRTKISSGNLLSKTGGTDKTFDVVNNDPSSDPTAGGDDFIAKSGLKSVFEGAAYARLEASLGSLSSFEDDRDSLVNPYAQYVFSYERVADADNPYAYSRDTLYRVTQEIVAAQGCTTCSDGFGIYRFQYDRRYGVDIYRFDDDPTPNVWRMRTTEWLSDATNPKLASGWVSTDLAYSTTTATVTWPSHGFSSGDEVTVSGVGSSAFYGTFTITVTSANTFTYTMSSTPPSVPTSGVTISNSGRLVARTLAHLSNPGGSSTTATAYWPGHGFAVGEEVTVSGTGTSPYFGTFEITSETADTFTYTMGSTPSSMPSGSVTITNIDRIDPAAWNDNDQHLVYTNERGGVVLKAVRERPQLTTVTTDLLTTTFTLANHGFKAGELIQVTSTEDGTYEAVAIESVTTNTFTISGTLGDLERVPGVPGDGELLYVQRVFPTANHYDPDGRMNWVAHPSAIEGYRESLDNLVGTTSTDNTLKETSGLFDLYVYGDDSGSSFGDGDSLSDTHGDADGYLNEVRKAHGFDQVLTPANSQLIYTLTYYKKSAASGSTIYPLARRLDSWDASNSAGGTETRFTYAWYNNGTEATNRAEMMTIHDAAVATTRNGVNAVTTRTAVYDSNGRRTWYRDGSGFIAYTEYDPTGSIRTQVQDVDTALVSNEPVDPATSTAWSTPSGAGLHLTTRFQTDGLGRFTRTIDANGNITHVVYDDPNHVVRTYSGWDPVVGTATGPTVVRREDWANKYRESLSMSLTPGVTSDAITSITRSASTATVDTTASHGLLTGATVIITGATQSEYNGMFIVTVVDSDTFSYSVAGSPASPATGTPVLNRRPSGTESIASATIHSLTRQLYNNAGQMIETDRYFAMPSGGYSASTAQLGTSSDDSGVHEYHDTLQQFDGGGRLKRVQTSSGTITRYLYDARGLLTQTWIGTDDSPSSSNVYWSPAYELANADTNLVLVEERAYDVDGNLTSVTEKPGNSKPDRVTVNSYDWRDRLVATKIGVETSTESASVNRQITYYTYDNQDRITSVTSYDGDGISLSVSNGVPQAPADSLMGSRTENLYDDRGRVYASLNRFINPSASPVVHSSKMLTTSYWYDDRNNVIKQAVPGAAATKTVYNGAGWVKAAYVTDAGIDTTGASDSPGTLVGDTVLEALEYTYDANGNVLIRVRRQRFDDASATGALTGPSGTGPNARVYYEAFYYDKRDRLVRTIDLGTNGGSVYSSSDRTSDTTASRSNTKLISDYEYDDGDRLWRTTNPRNFKTVMYYDLLGRNKKTIDAYVDGNVSDGDDRTTEYTYTGAGHIKTLRASLPDSSNDSDTLGGYQETEYVYCRDTPVDGVAFYSNEFLREVHYPTRADGSSNKDLHPAVSNVDTESSDMEFSAFNALGEKIKMTDRRGVIHDYSYDLMSRLTSDKVSGWGSSGNVDQFVDEIAYTFDSAGHTQTVTSKKTGVSTARNQVRYAYNGFGQVVTEAQNHSGTASVTTSPRTTYVYSEGVADSGSIYSNHSRLKQMSFTDGGNVNEVNYTYGSADSLNDSISRLASVKSDSTTVESYSYLGVGTYVQIDRGQAGTKLTYIASSNGDAGDKYAGLDRFGRIYDQNWTTSSTVLDRTNYSYDRNGNRYKKDVITSGAPSSGANQVDEQFVYDKLDRLIEARRGYLNSSTTMNSVRWLAGWSLDTLGNIKGYLTVTDPTFGDADLDGDVDFDDYLKAVQNYNTEQHLWADTDFDGDGMSDFDDLLITGQQYGNNFTGGNAQTTQSRGHNGQNQITWMDDDNDGTQDSGEALDYDASGSNKLDQDGRALKYDGWNRQVSMTDTNGTTLVTQYFYDGLSRQIGIDGREQYFDTDWQLVFEYDAANDVTAKYVWSPIYVDALILRDMDYNADTDYTDTNERVYSHWDANFNVTSVTDASGSVLERYRYEPYGARTVLNADFSEDTLAGSDSTASDDSTAGWNTSDFFFRNGHQGGMYDAVVQEKMQFAYREMDVEQMRWGRVDPAGYVDGPSLYNPYANNPISRVDPTGLFWDTIGDAIGLNGGDVAGAFWGGFGEGAAQGAANVANAGTDLVIEAINSPADQINDIASGLGFEDILPTIPDWDWSQGLVFEEDPCLHQLSKDLAKFGIICISAGWGMRGSRPSCPGKGSCFVAGTEVLRGDGSRTNIEEIRVGQRVATDGGAANSEDGKTVAADPTWTAVDPATWRLLTVEAGDWEVQTLQPLSWLSANGVEVGGSIGLDQIVDLKEMGGTDGLVGTVGSVSACPEVASGPGRVVLTTVNHLNDFVFDLTLTQDGKTETTGITGYHPVYVEGRGFVIASELTEGQVVRIAEGVATVTGVVQREGAFTVYNMTVEADHVYYVGDLSALVHNQCGDGIRTPGPHARESIPGPPNRKFTPDQRNEMDRIGRKHGCHRCGDKNAPRYVPDHQPPLSVNPNGPHQLFPHCPSCSASQGGHLRPH